MQKIEKKKRNTKKLEFERQGYNFIVGIQSPDVMTMKYLQILMGRQLSNFHFVKGIFILMLDLSIRFKESFVQLLEFLLSLIKDVFYETEKGKKWKFKLIYSYCHNLMFEKWLFRFRWLYLPIQFFILTDLTWTSTWTCHPWGWI